MGLKVGKYSTLKSMQGRVSCFRLLSIKPELFLQHLLHQHSSCRSLCERSTVFAGRNFLVALRWVHLQPSLPRPKKTTEKHLCFCILRRKKSLPKALLRFFIRRKEIPGPCHYKRQRFQKGLPQGVHFLSILAP